jgi:hypothetical protein
MAEKTAKDLAPGDVYRTVDGEWHAVSESWSLSHRTTVVHDDGTERALFPSVKVEVK